MTTTARFLMCEPRHFGVTYAINPWMNTTSWSRRSHTLIGASRREWAGLHRALRRLGASVELVPPVPGLPDLVFTANAAIVLDRKVVLARFRYPERAGEEPHFEAAFRALQARALIDAVTTLPESLVLEGAGDCVFDRARNIFWTGYGLRSDRGAAALIERTFKVEAVPLELADPRFYHLDTAFCPLTRGEALFVPAAFTPSALAALRARLSPEELIEVGIADACKLAANAVCVGDTIVMSECGERLRSALADRGYRVLINPLPSFLRSGGSAFCLTLRLDLQSRAALAANRNQWSVISNQELALTDF
jgi:N-dimethylarginine dimethylaminohydrolase